jgi:hypothetical protein
VLGEFVERYGISIVGGCCGTTPAHIEALAERVRGRTPGERPARRQPHASSMIAATPLVQDPRPTLVGERVNSQGSRKAKGLPRPHAATPLVVVAKPTTPAAPRAKNMSQTTLADPAVYAVRSCGMFQYQRRHRKARTP